MTYSFDFSGNLCSLKSRTQSLGKTVQQGSPMASFELPTHTWMTHRLPWESTNLRRHTTHFVRWFSQAIAFELVKQPVSHSSTAERHHSKHCSLLKQCSLSFVQGLTEVFYQHYCWQERPLRQTHFALGIVYRCRKWLLTVVGCLAASWKPWSLWTFASTGSQQVWGKVRHLATPHICIPHSTITN